MLQNFTNRFCYNLHDLLNAYFRSPDQIKMNTTGVYQCLVVMIAVISAISSDATEDKKRKLQIGVKKRVENCQRKSKKFDVLEMHYTVSCRTIHVISL